MQKKRGACTEDDIDDAHKEAAPNKANTTPVASSSGASASSKSPSGHLNIAALLEYFKPRKAAPKK